jgi:pimeloyl-ACP methyl ester carboxylesterase
MKDPIQFAHSNGFGFSTYRHLFSFLGDFDIKGVELMGHGAYEIEPNWLPLGQELIEYIEKNQTSPVIGIGHSLGGAALLYAAEARPDLFKQLIFLDPPLFNPFKRGVIQFIKAIGFYDKIAPSGMAKIRREYFSSKEEAYQYFKKKRLFKPLDDQFTRDYANYGLKENLEHGFELAFSREIESRVFENFPKLKKKILFEIPSSFIYSNQYNVLWKSDIRWLKRTLPNTNFIPIEGVHLFPQQYPAATAELIEKLIEGEK